MNEMLHSYFYCIEYYKEKTLSTSRPPKVYIPAMLSETGYFAGGHLCSLQEVSLLFEEIKED
ncbi:MAG: hypothetical protein GXO95_01130 [Nitrospirae bacterium]|nr:hypothetical protein [Nitrospirota bacterium]